MKMTSLKIILGENLFSLFFFSKALEKLCKYINFIRALSYFLKFIKILRYGYFSYYALKIVIMLPI